MGSELASSLKQQGASLVAQTVKNLLQCGRPGFDPWVRKIPWRGEWQPTLVFLPGEFFGQRGAWQATAHGVAKSHTGLSDFHFPCLSFSLQQTFNFSQGYFPSIFFLIEKYREVERILQDSPLYPATRFHNW